MPVARQQRQVGTAALPGARLTAAKTATSTGAGLAQAEGEVGQAIERLGAVGTALGVSTYGRVMEEERQRADNIALLKADNKISEWKNNRLFNTVDGAFTKKGADAMGLPEQVNDEFIALTSELEKDMNDRQRARFAAVRSQHGTGLDLTLRRYQLEETNRYEADELEAKIKNSLSSGWSNAQDPKQVGIDLEAGTNAIKLHMKQMGAGPKTIEQKTLEFSSAMHSGVIERLVNSGQDMKASAYFDEVKGTGQLTGKALGDIEKALETGSLRGESQRKADEITATGKSYDEMIAEVKKIKDPKLQDATRERVEHFDTKRDQQKREAEEVIVKNAYTIVERTKDWRSVPVSEWQKMSPASRSMLRSVSEHLTEGVPVKTVPSTYYTLTQEAVDDPDKFIKRNILESAGRLSPSDLEQMMNLQMQIKSSGKAAAAAQAAKTLNGLRTNSEIWNGVLFDSGLDKDSDEAHELHKELDRRIDALQDAKKGQATNTEMQEVADSLVGNIVLQPGSWSNIIPGGAPFYDVTKPMRSVTVADIPPNERSATINRLKQSGIPITDDSIFTHWVKAKRAMGQVKK